MYFWGVLNLHCLHEEFTGLHPANDTDEGHENDLTEVMSGVSILSGIFEPSKGFGIFRKAAGVVDFRGPLTADTLPST